MPDFHVAVIGAGPAGLMAAEVLAQGGARVTVYDRMPSVGRKFLLAGRGGLNLTHSEDLGRVSAALRRGDAASARRDRGVSAGGRARLVRGARPGDLRRIERPRVSQSVEDLAAAARVAAAARRGGRRLQAAASLDRLGRAGRRSTVRDAARARVGVHADAAVLALGGASWPRLGSDRRLGRVLADAGVAVGAAAAGQLRLPRPLVGGVPRALRGPAAEADRAVVSAAQSVRGEALITRQGLEGGGIYALSAPLREAIAAAGEAVLHIALRPGCDRRRNCSGGSPRRADKQSLSTFLRKAVEPVAARHRPAARGDRVDARALRRHGCARPRRAHQGRSGAPDRHGADRARHLDRRRHRLRRDRRRFHAAPAARRVRRGRDAGLGGADRRLSAAGVVRDRRRGGARRAAWLARGDKHR